MATSSVSVVLRILAERNPQFARELQEASRDLQQMEQAAGRAGAAVAQSGGQGMGRVGREADEARTAVERARKAVEQLEGSLREVGTRGAEALGRTETASETAKAAFDEAAKASDHLGDEAAQAGQRGAAGLRHLETALQRAEQRAKAARVEAEALARSPGRLAAMGDGSAVSAAMGALGGGTGPVTSRPMPTSKAQLAALAAVGQSSGLAAAAPSLSQVRLSGVSAFAGLDTLRGADQSIQRVTLSMRDLQGVSKALNTTLERAQEEYRKTTATAVEFGTRAGVAMVGAGAAVLAVGGYALKAASDFEQARAKLETVLKSASAARETFEFAKDLAASTPFNVQEVVSAAVQLEVYGAKAKEVLPLVADLAAGMGKRVEDVALVVGKAMSGSLEGFESLRNEYGVSSAKLAQYGAVLTKTGGISVQTASDLEKARQALQRVVQTEFGGAVERQSRTMQGAVSNMQDSALNLAATWGEDLVPGATLLAKVAGGVADGFAAIPGPMRAVVSIGTMLAAGTVALAGGATLAATGLLAMNAQLKAAEATMPQVARLANVTSGALGLVGRTATGVGTMISGLVSPWTLVLAGVTAVNMAVTAYEEHMRRVGEELEKESLRLQEGTRKWRAYWDAVNQGKGGQGKPQIDLGASPGEIQRAIEERLAGVSRLDALHEAQAAGFRDPKKDFEDAQAKIAQIKEDIEQAKVAVKEAQDAWGDVQTPTLRLKDLQFDLEQYRRLAAAAKAYADRVGDLGPKLDEAVEHSKRLDGYLKFGDKARDLAGMTEALSVLQDEIARMQGVGQSIGLNMGDPAALRKRLLDLKPEESEFQFIERYLELLDKQAIKVAAVNEANKKALDDRLALMDNEFSASQAGQAKDLAAEKQHLDAKLKVVRDARDKRLGEIDAEFAADLKAGRTSVERTQAYEKQKADAVRNFRTEETQLLNEAHANQEARQQKFLGDFRERFQDMTRGIQELAASGDATAGEVTEGYRGVLEFVERWIGLNQALLDKFPKIKEAVDEIRDAAQKQVVTSEKSDLEKRVADIKKEGQEILSEALTPTEQIRATKQVIDLYETALRTEQAFQGDSVTALARRRDMEIEINRLKKQQTALTEQQAEKERQLAQQLQSMRLQQMDAQVGMLEGMRGPSRRTAEQSQSLLRDALQATTVAELQALEERAAAGSRLEEELAERRKERFEQALKLIELELAAEVAAAKDSEAEKTAAHERARLKRQNLALEERQKVLQRLQEEVRAVEAAEQRKAQARERSRDRLGGSRSPLQSFEEAYSRGFKNPDFSLGDFELSSPEGFSFDGAGPNSRIQQPKPKQLGAEDQYLESLKRFSTETDAGAKAMTELTPALTEAAPATKDLGTAAVDSATSLGTLASAAASAAAALSSIAGAGSGGSGTGEKTGTSVGSSVAAGIAAGVPDARSGSGGGAPSADTGGAPQPPPSKYDFVQQRFGFPAAPRMPTPREMGAIPMPRPDMAALAQSSKVENRNTEVRNDYRQTVNIQRPVDMDEQMVADAASRLLEKRARRDRMLRGSWG